MNLTARCGICGESFRVAELLAPGTAGRCPRCGVPLAPGYVPVLDTAVRDLVAAAEALRGALWQIGEVAPQLRVDVAAGLCDRPEPATEAAP